MFENINITQAYSYCDCKHVLLQGIFVLVLTKCQHWIKTNKKIWNSFLKFVLVTESFYWILYIYIIWDVPSFSCGCCAVAAVVVVVRMKKSHSKQKNKKSSICIFRADKTRSLCFTNSIVVNSIAVSCPPFQRQLCCCYCCCCCCCCCVQTFQFFHFKAFQEVIL